MWRFALILCVLTPACIDRPDPNRAVPAWLDDAPYPKLINLDGVLAGQIPPEAQAEVLEDALTVRANRLKRRAAALNAGG